MEYIIEDDKVFLRLDKDEDLFSGIIKAAEKLNINTAHISAIGALKDMQLGRYNDTTKSYDVKTFPDVAELLSLDGNLSIYNGERYLHLHAILADENLNCFGGHVVEAKIAVTCEINLRILKTDVKRVMSETIKIPEATFEKK